MTQTKSWRPRFSVLPAIFLAPSVWGADTAVPLRSGGPYFQEWTVHAAVGTWAGPLTAALQMSPQNYFGSQTLRNLFEQRGALIVPKSSPAEQAPLIAALERSGLTPQEFAKRDPAKQQIILLKAVKFAEKKAWSQVQDVLSACAAGISPETFLDRLAKAEIARAVHPYLETDVQDSLRAALEQIDEFARSDVKVRNDALRQLPYKILEIEGENFVRPAPNGGFVFPELRKRPYWGNEIVPVIKRRISALDVSPSVGPWKPREVTLWRAALKRSDLAAAVDPKIAAHLDEALAGIAYDEGKLAIARDAIRDNTPGNAIAEHHWEAIDTFFQYCLKLGSWNTAEIKDLIKHHLISGDDLLSWNRINVLRDQTLKFIRSYEKRAWIVAPTGGWTLYNALIQYYAFSNFSAHIVSLAFVAIVALAFYIPAERSLKVISTRRQTIANDLSSP